MWDSDILFYLEIDLSKQVIKTKIFAWNNQFYITYKIQQTFLRNNNFISCSQETLIFEVEFVNKTDSYYRFLSLKKSFTWKSILFKL